MELFRPFSFYWSPEPLSSRQHDASRALLLVDSPLVGGDAVPAFLRDAGRVQLTCCLHHPLVSHHICPRTSTSPNFNQGVTSQYSSDASLQQQVASTVKLPVHPQPAGCPANPPLPPVSPRRVPLHRDSSTRVHPHRAKLRPTHHRESHLPLARSSPYTFDGIVCMLRSTHYIVTGSISVRRQALRPIFIAMDTCSGQPPSRRHAPCLLDPFHFPHCSDLFIYPTSSPPSA